MKEERRRQRHSTHSWVDVGGCRRCSSCSAFEGKDVSECSGTPQRLNDVATQAQQTWGHIIFQGMLHEGSTVLPSIHCGVCGGWASAGIDTQDRKLLNICEKGRSRAGQDVLGRIARGLHPKSRRHPAYMRVLGRWGSVQLQQQSRE